MPVPVFAFDLPAVADHAITGPKDIRTAGVIVAAQDSVRIRDAFRHPGDPVDAGRDIHGLGRQIPPPSAQPRKVGGQQKQCLPANRRFRKGDRFRDILHHPEFAPAAVRVGSYRDLDMADIRRRKARDAVAGPSQKPAGRVIARKDPRFRQIRDPVRIGIGCELLGCHLCKTV
jgi:hypothetical protein